MGHLNIGDLLTCDHEGIVRGMTITDSERDFKCEIYIRSKMTKTTFPKKSNRKTELLELIHSDVCGLMKVESIGKSRYFVTFIDYHSR